MAEVRIYAPNKSFSGKIGSVVFVNGEGVIDDEANQSELRYFKRHPFGIGEAVLEEVQETQEDDTPEPQKETPAEGKTPVDIPGMPNTKATRPEWVEFAEGMGINTEGLSIAQMREKIIEQHTAN